MNFLRKLYQTRLLRMLFATCPSSPTDLGLALQSGETSEERRHSDAYGTSHKEQKIVHSARGQFFSYVRLEIEYNLFTDDIGSLITGLARRVDKEKVQLISSIVCGSLKDDGSALSAVEIHAISDGVLEEYMRDVFLEELSSFTREKMCDTHFSRMYMSVDVSRLSKLCAKEEMQGLPWSGAGEPREASSRYGFEDEDKRAQDRHLMEYLENKHASPQKCAHGSFHGVVRMRISEYVWTRKQKKCAFKQFLLDFILEVSRILSQTECQVASKKSHIGSSILVHKGLSCEDAFLIISFNCDSAVDCRLTADVLRMLERGSEWLDALGRAELDPLPVDLKLHAYKSAILARGSCGEVRIFYFLHLKVEVQNGRLQLSEFKKVAKALWKLLGSKKRREASCSALKGLFNSISFACMVAYLPDNVSEDAALCFREEK
jgi:hypothetical protein